MCDATSTNLKGFFYAMNYRIDYRFEDDHCVIDVYRGQEFYLTYDFHLIDAFHLGVDHTVLDHIKNKIWGNADGIGEMWHEVQVQRLIRGL